jgi:thymidylate synthase (FAD)
LKLFNSSFKILDEDLQESNVFSAYKRMVLAAKTCYQTDNTNLTSLNDYAKWLKEKIINTGHHSVLEHSVITVDIVTDRGILGELTRHRTGIAFSVESSRYCSYNKNKFDNQINVIQPFFFDPSEETKLITVPELFLLENQSLKLKEGSDTWHMNSFDVWFLSCLWSEWGYNTLTDIFKRKSEEARLVLPLSLKTEIRMTVNLRELRHLIDLRALGKTGKPHPQIQIIFIELLKELNEHFPLIFEDKINYAIEKGLI